VNLPSIQDLEATQCRYPVLFYVNRGRPKKEVRLTKPNPSLQKCSRCHIQGIHYYYCYLLLKYSFICLIPGHNKKTCPLPSEEMILPSESPQD